MRVIAGKMRGLALKTITGRTTRPTAAKVKEAMFDILNPYLSPSMVGVDLFAGSGALGIEAVSRGLAQVYLIDKNRAAIKVIKSNVQKTREPERFTIWPVSYQQAMRQFEQQQIQFDLLLLDPPYLQHLNPAIVQAFIEQKLLKPQALILLETDYSLQAERRDDCLLIAAKQYGQTYIEIWQYQGDNSNG